MALAGALRECLILYLSVSTGTLRYVFQAEAVGANLTGTTNAVYVTLTIGGDSGATSVTAHINP